MQRSFGGNGTHVLYSRIFHVSVMAIHPADTRINRMWLSKSKLSIGTQTAHNLEGDNFRITQRYIP